MLLEKPAHAVLEGAEGQVFDNVSNSATWHLVPKNLIKKKL
jgi:hypothetical protein